MTDRAENIHISSRPRYPQVARWILVLGLLASTCAWRYLVHQAEMEARTRFLLLADQAGQQVSTHLEQLELPLRQVRTFLESRDSFTRNDWSTMVRAISAPAASGSPMPLAFVQQIPPAKLNEFLTGVRKDYAQGISLQPAGQRVQYFPVRFSEPPFQTPLQPGFDLAADDSIRTAAERARETGRLAFMPLPARPRSQEIQGALLLLPVFRTSSPAEILQTRKQQQARGWVASVVPASSLLPKLAAPLSNSIHLELAEKPQDSAATNPAGTSGPLTSASGTISSNPSCSTALQLQGLSRSWVLKITSSPSFDRENRQSLPLVTALLGCLGTLLLGALVASITRAQARTLSRAEEMSRALARSELIFRSLADSSPVGILHTDANGGCQYANPQWLALSGLTQAECLGDGWLAPIHPEDHARVLSEWTEARKSNSCFASEFRFVAAKGQVHWVSCRIMRMGSGASPQPGFVGTAVEITEKVLANQAARLLEQRYNLAVQGSNDGIWDWNMETGETFFSERFSELLGIRSGELEHSMELFEEMLEPEHRLNFRNCLDLHLGDRTPFDVEVRRLPNQEGQVHWLRIRGQALWNEQGKAVRMAGSLTEITDIKDGQQALSEAVKAAEWMNQELANTNEQLENAIERANRMTVAAQTASQAKSEFLANMSHEIRTPMNGVIGMTHLLLETDLTSEQREYSEMARNSAESLLTLINDILDFSKIEAGRLSFETIDFHLNGVLESTFDVLAPAARRKKIELTAWIDPACHRHLRGDPGRLRQVLTNLVSNAVKFTSVGEVAVTIRPVPCDVEGETALKFEVRDTGIGISPENQDRLFRSFVQADSSTTRKYGGTGLGLAISRKLVELMNGEIGVVSQAGQGSTFWFTIRLARQVNPPPDDTPETLAGIRCLAIDDNDTTRRAIGDMLESWKMRPVLCRDAGQAMPLLEEAARAGNPFKVALIELEMKGSSGIDFARIVRSNTLLQSTRCIVLSNEGGKLDPSVASASGISTLLGKPVRPSALFDAIANALSSTLELSPAKPTENSAEDEARKQAAANRKAVKILLAEDNMINQRLALRQLESLGYHAETATNGVEVLQKLEKGNFRIILMDCMMPEMDGFEATREIRKTEQQDAAANLGKPRHIRIIAMTANAMAGDREKCLAAGMDDYVSKPVHVTELQAVIERNTLNETATEASKPPLAPSPGPATKIPPQDASLVLDLVLMEELRLLESDDNAWSLTAVIDVFQKEFPARVQQMREAIARKDARSLARIAHSLKGSAAGLGARELAPACQQLETRAKDGHLNDAEQLLANIELAFRNLVPALEAQKSPVAASARF